MKNEEQKKIWRSLMITLTLGIAVLMVGFTIHFLGLARKLILWQLASFVFGGLAVGTALFKMMKFRKFLKEFEN